MKNLHDIPAAPRRPIDIEGIWADTIRGGVVEPYQQPFARNYFVHPRYVGDPREVLDIYDAAQEIAMSRRRGTRDRAVLMVSRREMEAIIMNTPAWHPVEGGERWPRLYGVRLVLDEARY